MTGSAQSRGRPWLADRWGATARQRAIGWLASMCVPVLMVLFSTSPSHAYTFPTSCTAADWTLNGGTGYPVSNVGVRRRG